MKKSILYIITSLFFTSVIAQDIKRCLFLGIYDGNKRGICSDREVVFEEIEDYFDFDMKSKAFNAEHKTQHPNTTFINQDECVIAYRYEREIVGWHCNSNVVSIKKGKSIEDCNNQLSTHLTKYPHDFTTSPQIIYTWKGKGKNSSEYTKDFGGVFARFISFKNNHNKDFIHAKFSNRLTDKTAIIIIQTDAGMITPEYLKPGVALSKTYDTKKMEIQIIYQEYNTPLPSFDVNSGINFIKGKIREQIKNDGGVIKSTPLRADGIRG